MRKMFFSTLYANDDSGKFCYTRRIRDPRRGPYGSGERAVRSDGLCPLTPIISVVADDNMFAQGANISGPAYIFGFAGNGWVHP